MSPAEIEKILKELEEDLLKEKPTDLKKIGIDEITHLKGYALPISLRSTRRMCKFPSESDIM
jgi:hypothetical protein